MVCLAALLNDLSLRLESPQSRRREAGFLPAKAGQMALVR